MSRLTRPRPILLLLLLLFPPQAAAESLLYSLKGLEGALRKNALAWLGDPPGTPQERLNFLVTAQDRVERSLQALGYYRSDISLEVQRTEPVWQLAISVEPGEPVRIREISVQLFGAAVDDAEFAKLLDAMPFVAGNVLHHGEFEQSRRRLLSLGQQRGYFDGSIVLSRVNVEPVGSSADIFLHYDSGTRYRFGDIQFDGQYIDKDLLEALRPFREGDYFQLTLVQKIQEQLQRTGYFSTVLVRPLVQQAQGDAVPLKLELYPAVRHSFDLGVGFSTDTQERLSVTWRTPKINRYGHSQETRVEYSSVNPSGRFTYRIPLGHPLNDVLQLSARLEYNEYGDLDSRQEELAVRRETRDGQWVRSYSLRGLNESWDILDRREDNDYFLPGLSLSHRDHSGSVVNPAAGFSQLYQLEAGGEQFGSDIDLLRGTAKFVYIASPGLRHRLVGGVELGAVWLADADRDRLAPSLSFFAGGSQSIRGFSYQSIGNEVSLPRRDGETKSVVIGGTRLLTASAEYQYQFNDSWRGALFADGGDAFDEGLFDFNYSLGFGVHYLTPVGAMRLELATPLSEDDPSWRLHLAIGAEF